MIAMTSSKSHEKFFQNVYRKFLMGLSQERFIKEIQ